MELLIKNSILTIYYPLEIRNEVLILLTYTLCLLKCLIYVDYLNLDTIEGEYYFKTHYNYSFVIMRVLVVDNLTLTCITIIIQTLWYYGFSILKILFRTSPDNITGTAFVIYTTEWGGRLSANLGKTTLKAAIIDKTVSVIKENSVILYQENMKGILQAKSYSIKGSNTWKCKKKN